MTKALSTILFLFSIIGSTAMAEIPTAALTEQGDLQALHRCDPQRPRPTNVDAMGGYCDNDGRQCPPGYDPVAKYCWGGWHHGWHRCGWACRSNGMYDGGGDGGGSNGSDGNGARFVGE